MIFCFSGTGNSLYVAKEVSKETNEEIIRITEDELKKNKKYKLKENEKLGFVFPIYWWGMPMIAEKFIKQMSIDNVQSHYVYAIATFGLAGNNGMHDLKSILAQKNIYLDSQYEVKMVDNYVVAYDIADKQKQKKILDQASVNVQNIINKIKIEDNNKISDLIGATLKPIVHHFYKVQNHKKKFYALDKCIGCGLCEKECPCNTIEINDGKPIWKDNCSFCLHCIHSCPVQAIQYGKGTEKRHRYINPKC